jgi:hypothetical protein
MTTPMMDAMLGSTVRERMWHDKVRPALYYDQHGREYSTMQDKETGDPAAPLTPTTWKAPFPSLFPPAKYQTFAPNRPGFVKIDYDRWIIDNSEANTEYKTWVLQVARQQFGAAALQKIQENDADLRRLAGPPPASVEVIKAMKAGNKWALGLLRPDGTRYPMPPWAADLWETLVSHEAFEGTGVGTDVDASQYPDVDDDAVEIADRYAAASQYSDIEEDADPNGLPDFQPIKRGRGRPPKER